MRARPGAPEWEPEVLIDTDVARRAIAKAFPGLATLPVRTLGEGWDNAAFLVGERYVFRFPRRAIAIEFLETEVRVLPAIGPQLPLPVPIPRFVGELDTEGWPFAGYEILPGRAISSAQLSDGEYRGVAADVGAFLRALHSIPAETVPGLGGDRIGRLDHARCMPKAARRLHALQDAGVIESATVFEDLLERNAQPFDSTRPSTTALRASARPSTTALRASARPSTTALRASAQDDRGVVVHGDVYGRHVLVNEDGRACGVIDWGDVHADDPAVDIAAAFEAFPPEARDAFFDAYGKVDERMLRVARYRGIYHSALVAHYGLNIGDQELLRAGRAGLFSCLL